MKQYWSTQETNKLIKIHKKKHTSELCRIFNRSAISIRSKMYKLNLKSGVPFCGKRKTTVNENFFSKPNLLNSYWAGFIAADGCIFKKNKGSMLTIHLNKKDKKLLNKFKKDIQFSGKIVNKTKTNSCQIFIHRDNICKDLMKNFNITPRKSLTLKPPKGLTKRQALAYIVGYIDGDGCISQQHNKPKLSIIGTQELLKWAHLTLNLQIAFKKIPIRKVKNHKIYTYVLYSNKAIKALQILNTAYKSTLNRKWSKIYVHSS